MRQDVSVGDYVKDPCLPEFVLHFCDVVTEPIFSCDFVAGREMVDALILVETLVQIGFARGGGPKQVPIMGICVMKAVCL